MRRGVALAAVLVLVASGIGVAQSPGSDLNLTVKYGVLVALTGTSGASGQLWNQATAVGVAYVNKTLKEMGLSSRVNAQLVDSQDSQSQAASGVEGARKLVFIDHVNVVMGDILSAVTAAVATSVTIPNHVVEFTGGTATSLPDINPKGIPPLLYQPPASNALEGVVLSYSELKAAIDSRIISDVTLIPMYEEVRYQKTAVDFVREASVAKKPPAVDLELIRGWWSFRSLVVIRWLADNGYGSPETFPEVAVLRSQP